ncbi:MAG: response regulator transcription factor [Mogibacterium sp.]|nr:response regulator transcription factor [Mogibacterium sp.]
MVNKILIAEDDKDIVELLRLYLENAGFEVASAENGRLAYELAMKEDFGLAIIDVMMPEMNGFELIRKLRLSMDMPIIVLSAMDSDSDKIMGLDIGADDYVTKPFNPLEIVARVRAGFRRQNFSQMTTTEDIPEMHIKSGELEIEPEMFRVRKRGEELQLTLTEFMILSMLMKNPGRVFTRAQIFERLNGDDVYCKDYDDHSIMVHISNLREKIEDNPRQPEYLKTVRGLGYRFEKK